MDVDDEEDPVPEITKKHLEEAMKFARRWINRIHMLLYFIGQMWKVLVFKGSACEYQQWVKGYPEFKSDYKKCLTGRGFQN